MTTYRANFQSIRSYNVSLEESVVEASLQRLLEEGPLSLELVVLQLDRQLLSWMGERHMLLDACLSGSTQAAFVGTHLGTQCASAMCQVQPQRLQRMSTIFSFYKSKTTVEGLMKTGRRLWHKGLGSRADYNF